MSTTADSHPIPAAEPAEPVPPPRRVRSYVLRAGRMGTGQQRALRELGPIHVLPWQPNPPDWDAVFGRHAPRVLEIGFGMGQATAEVAAARPDLDILGVEVHEPGVGALLRQIGERGLGNVRIVQHDAVEVLQTMIEPGTLAGIHVWFPDPWPKLRHHKRRLIQPPLVALLAERLAPGGWLHLATDWVPYAEQMLTVLRGEPRLEPKAEGWDARPALRPLTKFEARGLKLGHEVRDLVFTRRHVGG